MKTKVGSDDVDISGSDVAVIAGFDDVGGVGHSDANVVLAKSCSEFFIERFFVAVEHLN